MSPGDVGNLGNKLLPKFNSRAIVKQISSIGQQVVAQLKKVDPLLLVKPLNDKWSAPVACFHRTSTSPDIRLHSVNPEKSPLIL
jgi:hypothetical protein